MTEAISRWSSPPHPHLLYKRERGRQGERIPSQPTKRRKQSVADQVSANTDRSVPVPIITKIERQKKNVRRASIYVDGEFAIGVHEETLRRFGFRKGDVLDRKTLDELQQAEELLKAKEKAMRLLSHRARSEKEIRDRLKKASHPSSIIDEVAAALKRAGLLDDVAFARMFAHDTMARKPLGRHLLRQLLRTKGVAKEIIENLIEEMYTPETEEDFALTLARKRLARTHLSSRRLSLQESLKLKKRLAGYLVRRGFDWDTVASVMSKLLPNHS